MTVRREIAWRPGEGQVAQGKRKDIPSAIAAEAFMNEAGEEGGSHHDFAYTRH